MILTTGYEVQGFYITEYIDVIFDEILVGLGFGKSFPDYQRQLMLLGITAQRRELIRVQAVIKDHCQQIITVAVDSQTGPAFHAAVEDPPGVGIFRKQTGT